MSSLSNRYHNILRQRSIAILINMVLLGCGGVNETTVLKVYDANKERLSLAIIEGNSTVYVPSAFKDLFRQKLNDLLIDKGKFKRGTDLKIVYSYTQFVPGNQTAHNLIMGGMGEGSITVNVAYIDNSGNKISGMQTSQKISVGYPTDVALEECATQIALYTERNFLYPGTKILTNGDREKANSREKTIINNKTNGKEKMKGWWETVK